MKKKILRVIVVMVILVLSYGMYYFMAIKVAKKPAETISSTSLSQGINPVGKFSDGAVEEVSTAKQFYEMNSYDYMIVTALDVVPTGVYKRKAWVGPYDASSSGTRIKNRRKTPIPEQSDNPLTDAVYMQQYYLIKLSDGSYINAILEEQYVNKIKSEGKFTLPIGVQEGINDNVKQMLAPITKEYGVEPTPVLYMVDNTWYSENEQGLEFKAMLWGIGTFIVLLVISSFTTGNLFVD